MSGKTLIDIALETLAQTAHFDGEPYNGHLDNKVLASYRLPSDVDEHTGLAVAALISDAIRELAKKDRLFSKELGAAEMEQGWDDPTSLHLYHQKRCRTGLRLDGVQRSIDVDYGNADRRRGSPRA